MLNCLLLLLILVLHYLLFLLKFLASIPGTDHQRFSKEERWTGVLQRMLGDKFEIIEEGLNSRTLISVDKRKDKEGRSGAEYLLPCLDTHDSMTVS